MLGRVRPLHVGTALLRKARAGAVQQQRRRVEEWTSALVRPMSTGFGGLQYDTLVEMQERYVHTAPLASSISVADHLAVARHA